MRSTYLWATGIAILLLAWLASGQLNQEPVVFDPSIAERNEQDLNQLNDQTPTRVRVVQSQAQLKTRYASVRGKTQNKRTVQVRSEIQGLVVNRAVERGQSVAANQLLCGLSVDDRQAALVESQQRVNQARIDYEGAKQLRAKGYNSESAIASAKANLATARAELKRRDLTLRKTEIRAPFAGFIENVHVEIGDYAQPGTACATLVDLNPMLLVGRVSERVVLNIEPGIEAVGELADRSEVRGLITFVGQQDDPATRTYAIEVEIDNESGKLRSGMTTQIRIPVEEAFAHKISPALFSLDNEGGYGVRVVNNDDRVEFYSVTVVAEDEDGVWVSGLPNTSNIITVGQELVISGERVDPVFINETLAKSPKPAASEAGT
ncbi:MAG: efflux RND transporter periplasmic adaptor subunit [Luminiphilus sp.]|nr:efflux RND transporter periplasmic adaptor subunit [Luminiphilus sp.]